MGLVDPELDARYVASALGSMVDRSLYVWLVLGEPFDEEIALHTLNVMCIRALGLEPSPVPATEPSPRRGQTRSGRVHRRLTKVLAGGRSRHYNYGS